MMALHISAIQFFFYWRILIGPVAYPALVIFHYMLRSLVISYMSLATAGRLVQLGMVVSFERVVSLQEGWVMFLVAASCLTTTAIHLLLEAVSRHQMDQLHIGRWPSFTFLSGGKYDPSSLNIPHTGEIGIPHLILFILVYLAVAACKLRDATALLARYRFALIQSGANGRLTCSALSVLAVFMFIIMVINWMFPTLLDPYTNNYLPWTSFLFPLLAFWLGCGSFLADPEPRQFILRRLGRAWAGWRAGQVEAGRAKTRRVEAGLVEVGLLGAGRMEAGRESGDTDKRLAATVIQVGEANQLPPTSDRRQQTQSEKPHTSITRLGEYPGQQSSGMPDCYI